MDIGMNTRGGSRTFLFGDEHAAWMRPMYGPQSMARNRHMLAVPNTTYVEANCMVEWQPADDITELNIFATYNAGTAPANVHETFLDYVVACLNAPSPAVAAAWLVPGTEFTTTDAQFIKIPLMQLVTIQSANAIIRLDVLSVSCVSDIWIGAN